MVAGDQDELIEMRCRSCGISMGQRKRIGRFVFWCSEECADTPSAKWHDTQARDEVAVELFLRGINIMEIARFTESQYQMIQQLLARRGITKGDVIPEPRPEEELIAQAS